MGDGEIYDIQNSTYIFYNPFRGNNDFFRYKRSFGTLERTGRCFE